MLTKLFRISTLSELVGSNGAKIILTNVKTKIACPKRLKKTSVADNPSCSAVASSNSRASVVVRPKLCFQVAVDG